MILIHNSFLSISVLTMDGRLSRLEASSDASWFYKISKGGFMRVLLLIDLKSRYSMCPFYTTLSHLEQAKSFIFY